MMSNSLKNLLIVLVISGVILYLINDSPKIVSEKFSMLSNIISSTNSIVNSDDNEDDDQLLDEELEIENEQLLDDENSVEEERTLDQMKKKVIMQK
jgi:hypothetical protein